MIFRSFPMSWLLEMICNDHVRVNDYLGYWLHFFLMRTQVELLVPTVVLILIFLWTSVLFSLMAAAPIDVLTKGAEKFPFGVADTTTMSSVQGHPCKGRALSVRGLVSPSHSLISSSQSLRVWTMTQSQREGGKACLWSLLLTLGTEEAGAEPQNRRLPELLHGTSSKEGEGRLLASWGTRGEVSSFSTLQVFLTERQRGHGHRLGWREAFPLRTEQGSDANPSALSWA